MQNEPRRRALKARKLIGARLETAPTRWGILETAPTRWGIGIYLLIVIASILKDFLMLAGDGIQCFLRGFDFGDSLTPIRLAYL